MEHYIDVRTLKQEHNLNSTVPQMCFFLFTSILFFESQIKMIFYSKKVSI